MDNFLTKLFAEEQEKVASAELGQFMDQLSTDELEDFLGIHKVAVEGKPEPSLPESLPTGKLEALQQQKRDYVDQEHEGTPKKVASQPEGAQTGVKYEGPGKEATGKTAEDAATEKVAWADCCGRLFAKQASELSNIYLRALLPNTVVGGGLGAGIGALGGEKGHMGRGARKGALIGGGIGAGANLGAILGSLSGNLPMAGLGGIAGGVGGGLLGAALERRIRAREAMDKSSMGMPESEGAGMESTASVKAIEKKGEEEKKRPLVNPRLIVKRMLGRTRPAEKAKIASMALKVSAGAPEHVKAAAVFMAGREIAKLSEVRPDFGQRVIQGKQRLEENKALQIGGRGAIGGGLGGLIGHSLGGTKGALIGALGGAALGAGAGALQARGARRHREALQSMK